MGIGDREILLKHAKLGHAAVLLAAALGLVGAGCGSLPSSGPSVSEVGKAQKSDALPIQVVDVNQEIAQRSLALERRGRFAEAFPGGRQPEYRVGAGDMLEISIWEAPPAALFGSATIDSRAGPATTRMTAFPEQMISPQGTISVPFAGAVPVAGKSPQEIEGEIARRLKGKANQPQVLVRVTRNTSSNVTVVGEVAQSQRMPLTAKGERLLDAIAAAGGVRQPVGRMTVQITRGETVHAMALDAVILDPRQNILLQPGDVVTALYQPLSFTALGATGKNEEIAFEAQGITLAQALARAGGVQDARADASGVFIFRFEEPTMLATTDTTAPTTPDGRVPVVYRLDLKDPRSFLLAQGFRMRNKDVVYVANAPAAELQKFLNILTAVIFTGTGLAAIGN
jgi:polysaccharide biosynthesis/export protein